MTKATKPKAAKAADLSGVRLVPSAPGDAFMLLGSMSQHAIPGAFVVVDGVIRAIWRASGYRGVRYMLFDPMVGDTITGDEFHRGRAEPVSCDASGLSDATATLSALALATLENFDRLPDDNALAALAAALAERRSERDAYAISRIGPDDAQDKPTGYFNALMALAFDVPATQEAIAAREAALEFAKEARARVDAMVAREREHIATRDEREKATRARVLAAAADVKPVG